MGFIHMSAPGDDIDEEDFTWEQVEIPGVSALAGGDPAEDARRELRELQTRMAAIWHELDGMYQRLQDLRRSA